MSPKIGQNEKLSAPRSSLQHVTSAHTLSTKETSGSDTDGSRDASVRPDTNATQIQTLKYVCNLTIHDVGPSREDILVDMQLLAGTSMEPGDLMRIGGIQGSSHNQYSHEGPFKLLDTDGRRLFNLEEDKKHPNETFLFHIKPMPLEMIAKHPEVKVSVSSQTATAFHLAKGSQVVLTPVDKAASAASHVEIIFRDQYLSRGDMWRLVNSELVDKCVYKGQRLVFRGSIKATVKSVYIDGRKALSAFFSPYTKPIFRSESARYVLFVQMSKEMWEFDAEGTGEIMFDKVINGFLPELFKRWQAMKAKHLLSIILFSRMLYDHPSAKESNSKSILGNFSQDEKSNLFPTQDFYRVVVSDMPSGESPDILDQLKKEFKVFLRDTSLRRPEAGSYAPIETGLSGASTETQAEIISGRPSTAAQGNILEAINLASSQFSSDYIDRDLVRTGVSVVVISPGTGVFEVDYDLLAATTDNLIDNGVGIDLVCLSRMPLHSVPLFQYKSPPRESKFRQKARSGHTPASNSSFGTPSPSSYSPGSYNPGSAPSGGWSYGIPHWVDVSFWTSMEENQQQMQKKLPKSKLKQEELHGPRHKPFTPRVKLYELQMMGIMENGERQISVPQLLHAENYATSRLSQLSITSSHFGSRSLQSGSLNSFNINANQAGAGSYLPSASSSPNSSKFLGAAASQIRKMDEYDDSLFRHPFASRRRRLHRRPKQKLRKEKHSLEQIGHMKPRNSFASVEKNLNNSASDGVGSPSVRVHQVADETSTIARFTEAGDKPRKTGTMPRSISFGLRGLTPKATPTVTAQVDVTQSPAWTAKTPSKSKPASDISTWSEKKGTLRSPGAGFHSLSDQDSSLVPSSDSDRQDSRPIPIRNIGIVQATNSGSIGISPAALSSRKPQILDRISALSDMGDNRPSEHDLEFDEPPKSLPPVLSPSTALAPWLTILNPSNPSKSKLAETSRLGRWQHIFPRAPKSSQIKWKSLCSPAAVPLTTEEFPTPEELEEEYERDSYIVTLPEEMDLSEHPHSLIPELVAFRLSRGFQIVVGDRLAEVQPAAAEVYEMIFSDKMLGNSNSTVFLSRGSTIHRLTRSSIDRLEIEVLTRHSVAANDKKTEENPMSYTPSVRSMLADTYELRRISIAPQRGSFNWDMIDAFIAGHERPQATHFVEHLRPWRARFVLIPVDPPSTARRSNRPSEDSEEEIRLEGINKLTQLWQRFRFVPPDEKGFQPQLRKSKDQNPLAISYQTKDPSAVIAAELESALEGDETGRPVQLLPEPDLYQRSNLNLRTLAETLQGEKGVRMLDRRWHFRLHYSCFIGFELTTWLLQNFRDIETREEAEKLGKELMKNGLFKHVEQRHDFRDGNYFYQIESDYRTSRMETKGWFGRGKSSVPSTPAVEKPNTEPPKTTRSRASSNVETVPDIQNSIETEKKPKLRVALSKFLRYDVDHRRRSYRRELINLHFDRLHNPDNCYHIRIEWMDTTPRLIQEAVISWATLVERFGLRLVEVPIGEASSITAIHPFRAPYMVKLAQGPPVSQPREYFNATTFVAQAKTDPLFYQKAIMKHFNFVLDFEAASSFSPEVNVTYSWGKPDYRYPQYIHRSGVLIAQITDDGDFLLLANRLYNDRNAGASFSHNEALSHPLDIQRERALNIHHTSAPRTTQRSPSRPTPNSSPAIRPTNSANLDIPPSPTPFRGPSPTKPNTPSSTTTPSFLDRAGLTKSTSASPEKITKDFQNFCSSPATLDAFYAAVLSKATTPASTPFLAATAVAPDGRAKTPLLSTPLPRITDTEAEGEIPSLDLPSSVFGGGKSLTSPPGSAAAARKGRERESLKQDVKEAMKAEMRRVETKRLSGAWESPTIGAGNSTSKQQNGKEA